MKLIVLLYKLQANWKNTFRGVVPQLKFRNKTYHSFIGKYCNNSNDTDFKFVCCKTLTSLSYFLFYGDFLCHYYVLGCINWTIYCYCNSVCICEYMCVLHVLVFMYINLFSCNLGKTIATPRLMCFVPPDTASCKRMGLSSLFTQM